jgi:hypothetical protein
MKNVEEYRRTMKNDRRGRRRRRRRWEEQRRKTHDLSSKDHWPKENLQILK